MANLKFYLSSNLYHFLWKRYRLREDLHSHCCWFYKASSSFLSRGSVSSDTTQHQTWRQAATAAFLALLLPLIKVQHCMLTRCIRKWQRLRMYFAQCKSLPTHSGPAVLNPPLLPPLMCHCLAAQSSCCWLCWRYSELAPVLGHNTAAPVKPKGKGGRESIGRLIIPCLQQGEDRPCKGSLSKSENSSVIKQSR